jgi:hypothetical protein
MASWQEGVRMLKKPAWVLMQGPLLEALSSFRYVAHSFAPVIALVAAEEAARSGVAFAGNPVFQGMAPDLITHDSIQDWQQFFLYISGTLLPDAPKTLLHSGFSIGNAKAKTLMLGCAVDHPPLCPEGKAFKHELPLCSSPSLYQTP